MKPIALMLFITKFIADTIGVSVYLGRGSWMLNFICVALPLLDFLFIHTYFLRAAKAEEAASNKRLSKSYKKGR